MRNNACLLRPEKEEMEEIKLDLNKEEVFNELKKLINEKEKIEEFGSFNLPIPLENVIVLTDANMLTNNSKYNFSLLGYPIFGNTVFLQISEEGKIIDMEEKIMTTCKKILKDIKVKDKAVGRYKKFNETSKEEIMKEIERVYHISDNDEENNEE